MSKQSEIEKTEALERIRTWVKPGDTVYCILRSVAPSGCSRVIQLVVFHEGRPVHLGYNVAKACGYKYDDRKEGVKIQGGGMDMGFALVYDLAGTLYPDGFTCIGEGCPASDHNNGDRDYTPHQHKSGGYALKHQWI